MGRALDTDCLALLKFDAAGIASLLERAKKYRALFKGTRYSDCESVPG